MTGILGKKIGMTQVFDETGKLVAVTCLEAGPCPVLKVMDKKIQLGFDLIKGKVNKPTSEFFKKINVQPQRFIKEIVKDTAKEYKVGDELRVDIFKPGDYVDITGVSIGKGFQGGMKRWNWSGAPMTHGSTSHRRVGSLGSSTTPGRVWKGHHLPGHMGQRKVSIQNLRVIKVDAQNNFLLVNGSVPGKRNNYIVIKKAIKK